MNDEEMAQKFLRRLVKGGPRTSTGEVTGESNNQRGQRNAPPGRAAPPASGESSGTPLLHRQESEEKVNEERDRLHGKWREIGVSSGDPNSWRQGHKSEEETTKED